jgi:hypothetical protein
MRGCHQICICVILNCVLRHHLSLSAPREHHAGSSKMLYQHLEPVTMTLWRLQITSLTLLAIGHGHSALSDTQHHLPGTLRLAYPQFDLEQIPDRHGSCAHSHHFHLQTSSWEQYAIYRNMQPGLEMLLESTNHKQLWTGLWTPGPFSRGHLHSQQADCPLYHAPIISRATQQLASPTPLPAGRRSSSIHLSNYPSR